MQIIISQPRYLPAICYLNRLRHADLFVFLDDVQRQCRDFENRNRIFDCSTDRWLSIPIASSKYEKINNVLIADNGSWREDHFQKLQSVYKKAPFWDADVARYLGGYDLKHDTSLLFCAFTEQHLKFVCEYFGFVPNLAYASTLDIDHEKKGPDHLRDITDAVGADTYISGPNGRDYNVMAAFEGKQLYFHDYVHPVYPQRGNSFVPWLAFFDALFFIGKDAVQALIDTPLELTDILGNKHTYYRTCK